jgi:hypothetical protein
MRTIPKSWPITIVARRKEKINPKPQYQRTRLWTLKKKQLLIDSILRGYDIPKFYLRTSSEPEYEHEVVDGQQRLRTIWEFIEGDFVLSDDSCDLPQGDLSGHKYSELLSDIQDQIDLYELNIHIIEDATDLEIRELFLRLQEGVPLNPAEKRNAMPGYMRDFIAELAENHRVFPLTSINNNRFAWDDLTALVTRLEMEGGPVDIKAPDLRKMYENNQDFDANGSTAKKIRRVLNYMADVLKSRPPEMRIKWGFVDLYLLLSKLLDQYDIKDREEEICGFFISFEQERLSVEDPADLLEHGDTWDKEMYEYIQAFQSGGGKRTNVQQRHKVYINRVLRDLPNLVPKDEQRGFTTEQKVAIWRRDDGICQNCKEKVAFEEMHADHVKPHSRGGRTTVDNGQTLCASCNLSKGAKK